MEYIKLFGDIKGANIYFFGTGDTIVMFSYIQSLSNNNKIFFYPNIRNKFKKVIEPSIVENWKTKTICKVVKILLGIDIKVRKDCGLYRLCIYKEFFEKNKVQEIYKNFDKDIYKKYMKDLNLKDKKVLLLLSDLVADGRMNSLIFARQMTELVRSINKYYPSQYIVKPHPNLNKMYGAMKNVPTLDSYIPSQFVMNHPWEVVIADCSAALVSPEDQNLSNVKLIELTDILEFKDDKVKKELKEFLLKWNPNLLFPQSFEELEDMIGGEKNEHNNIKSVF